MKKNAVTLKEDIEDEVNEFISVLDMSNALKQKCKKALLALCAYSISTAMCAESEADKFLLVDLLNKS